MAKIFDEVELSLCQVLSRVPLVLSRSPISHPGLPPSITSALFPSITRCHHVGSLASSCTYLTLGTINRRLKHLSTDLPRPAI